MTSRIGLFLLERNEFVSVHRWRIFERHQRLLGFAILCTAITVAMRSSNPEKLPLEILLVMMDALMILTTCLWAGKMLYDVFVRPVDSFDE
ncbi:MAG TPA: hypothetical protein VGE13_01550 [Candidatus Saccharimonadales bacterium]